MRWDPLLAHETLRKSHQFCYTCVRLPTNPTIVENLNDDTTQRAAKSFNAIPGLPICRFAQALNDLHHAVAIEYASNVMSNSRANLTFASGWQISEKRRRELATDCGKSIAIEKQEGSLTVKRF